MRHCLKIKAEFRNPESDLNEKYIFEHLLKVAPEGSVLDRNGNHKSI